MAASKSAGWSYVNEPRTTAWRRTIVWAVTSQRAIVEAKEEQRPADLEASERNLDGPRRADGVHDEVEAPLVLVRGRGGSAQLHRECDAVGVHVTNVDGEAPIEEGKRHEQALGADPDHQDRRG